MAVGNGIDTSNNNRLGNGAIAAPDPAGIEFNIVKATESTSFVDSTYNAWADWNAQHGILHGAYHFAHPDQHDPHDEAEYFWQHAKDRGPKIVALDCEPRHLSATVTINPMSVLGPQRLAEWCNDFLGHLSTLTSAKQLLYVNRDYLSHMVNWLHDHALWLAVLEYGRPRIQTYAGRDVTIEQYAIVDNIDRNIAYKPLTAAPAPTPHTKDDERMELCTGPDGKIYKIAGFLIEHIEDPHRVEQLVKDGVPWHQPAQVSAEFVAEHIELNTVLFINAVAGGNRAARQMLGLGDDASPAQVRTALKQAITG